MITEVPRFVPARQDFFIPLPSTPDNYPEIPYHLRKHVLKGVRDENYGVVPESLWHKRRVVIEKRVKHLLAAQDGVKEVIRHHRNSREDALGYDLSVFFEDGSMVYVQVKSSRDGIRNFKQAIRDTYFPGERNSMELVSLWMTENSIILINGSETRSDEDIIQGGFLPQLQRIRVTQLSQ